MLRGSMCVFRTRRALRNICYAAIYMCPVSPHADFDAVGGHVLFHSMSSEAKDDEAKRDGGAKKKVCLGHM